MASDPTEQLRRVAAALINVISRDQEDLEKLYGKVWDTEELKRDFEVLGFLAPFVFVIRKTDNQKGSLTFQHLPRFYFGFEEFHSDNDGP